MPAGKRSSNWIYIVLAILCLGPMVAFVVFKKFIEPKNEAAARAAAAAAAAAPAPFNTIAYQGQTIQLSKAYANFEAYKDDPNNIAPNETARVQKLVTQALVRVSYGVNQGFDQLIREVPFPGYAIRKFDGSLGRTSGPVAGFAIEIP